MWSQLRFVYIKMYLDNLAKGVSENFSQMLKFKVPFFSTVHYSFDYLTQKPSKPLQHNWELLQNPGSYFNHASLVQELLKFFSYFSYFVSVNKS